MQPRETAALTYPFQRSRQHHPGWSEGCRDIVSLDVAVFSSVGSLHDRGLSLLGGLESGDNSAVRVSKCLLGCPRRRRGMFEGEEEAVRRESGLGKGCRLDRGRDKMLLWTRTPPVTDCKGTPETQAFRARRACTGTWEGKTMLEKRYALESVCVCWSNGAWASYWQAGARARLLCLVVLWSQHVYLEDVTLQAGMANWCSRA